jgi:hypothetical protein
MLQIVRWRKPRHLSFPVSLVVRDLNLKALQPRPPP